jgi:hypothetical protein
MTLYSIKPLIALLTPFLSLVCTFFYRSPLSSSSTTTTTTTHLISYPPPSQTPILCSHPPPQSGCGIDLVASHAEIIATIARSGSQEWYSAASNASHAFVEQQDHGAAELGALSSTGR